MAEEENLESVMKRAEAYAQAGAVDSNGRSWHNFDVIGLKVYGTPREAQRDAAKRCRVLEGICPNGCAPMRRMARDEVQCPTCETTLVGQEYRAEGDRF